MKKIIDSTGNIYIEILNQVSNSINLNSVVESNIPKLTKVEYNQLEGKLTLPELGKAVRNMKNGKSIGLDGFTVEFYKKKFDRYLPISIKILKFRFLFW